MFIKKIPVKGLAGDAAALCDLADSDRIDQVVLPFARLRRDGIVSPWRGVLDSLIIKAPFYGIATGAIVFSKFYHIFPKGESLFAPVSSLFRYHREAFKKTPYYPRSSHADDTEFLLYLNELQMAEPKGRPVFMRDRSQRQGSQRWIRMQTGQPGI